MTLGRGKALAQGVTYPAGGSAGIPPGVNYENVPPTGVRLRHASQGAIPLIKHMIGPTFLLYDDQKHPNKCEILVDSYCDYTSSGHEAEVAEQIMVAAIKAMRLEQSVCVVREGSRTTIKGRLSLYNAAGRKRQQS